MPVRHVVLVTYGEPPTPGFLDQLVYSWRILLGLTRTVAPTSRNRSCRSSRSRAARPRHDVDRRSVLDRRSNRLPSVQAGRFDARSERRDPPSTGACTSRMNSGTRCCGSAHGDSRRRADRRRSDVCRRSAFTHGLSRARRRRSRPCASGGATQVIAALDARVLGRSAPITCASGARARGPDGTCALVLAAHGTLLEPERPIDTGLAATEALCDAIRVRAGRRLRPRHQRLAESHEGRPLDRATHRGRAAGRCRRRFQARGLLSVRVSGGQRRNRARRTDRAARTAGYRRLAPPLPQRVRSIDRSPRGRRRRRIRTVASCGNPDRGDKHPTGNQRGLAPALCNAGEHAHQNAEVRIAMVAALGVVTVVSVGHAQKQPPPTVQPPDPGVPND